MTLTKNTFTKFKHYKMEITLNIKADDRLITVLQQLFVGVLSQVPTTETKVLEKIEADKTEAKNEPVMKRDVKQLTIEDCRQANSTIRAKFGDNDGNDVEAEGYKNHHKKFTAAFKGVLSSMGVNKLSELTADRYGEYINKVSGISPENDYLPF